LSSLPLWTSIPDLSCLFQISTKFWIKFWISVSADFWVYSGLQLYQLGCWGIFKHFFLCW